ncbi:MAG TPA: BsuBI/PstI family type II restriction endonuclease, partial [Coleofasciculaceae cyanobacterium]
TKSLQWPECVGQVRFFLPGSLAGAPRTTRTSSSYRSYFSLQKGDMLPECSAGVVYISAFENMQKFAQFSKEIGWETEVWVADNPDHMIHFDGERFLGPYA